MNNILPLSKLQMHGKQIWKENRDYFDNNKKHDIRTFQDAGIAQLLNENSTE